MSKAKWLAGLAVAVFMATGCEIFEDQTPEFMSFRMTGAPGQVVTVLYSKQFVAGVDETGITRLEIFGADTVVHTLPIDTLLDVRLEQRMYIQAEPFAGDTIPVEVRVEVDGRSLFDRSGSLFPTIPWRFLYQFNHRFTDRIEVII